MPGHDEEVVRKARDEGSGQLAGDGGAGLGGTGRLGDVGAGGAVTDPDAFGRMAGGQVAPDDPVTGVGDVDGVVDTDATDAAHEASRDRLPPGLGASGDRTDEDLLENP
jgi:hypothetical protein